MKPYRQRIAIAKACGFKWSEYSDELGQLVAEFMPDYLKDLNAIHEAEKVLTQQQRIEYVCELGYIWTGRNDRAILNWWFVHDATAAQRAEAFLRTIGKWEDDE
jgi:hypothetical protein